MKYLSLILLACASVSSFAMFDEGPQYGCMAADGTQILVQIKAAEQSLVVTHEGENGALGWQGTYHPTGETTRRFSIYTGAVAPLCNPTQACPHNRRVSEALLLTDMLQAAIKGKVKLDKVSYTCNLHMTSNK